MPTVPFIFLLDHLPSYQEQKVHQLRNSTYILSFLLLTYLWTLWRIKMELLMIHLYTNLHPSLMANLMISLMTILLEFVILFSICLPGGQLWRRLWLTDRKLLGLLQAHWFHGQKYTHQQAQCQLQPSSQQ